MNLITSQNNFKECKDIENDLIIIIDIFRAGSSILSILDRNALKIIYENDYNKSINLSKKTPNSVLVGESNSLQLENYDYDNSPTKLFNLNFSDKIIIFKTSNCTKTILNFKKSKKIIFAGYNNHNSICTYINLTKKDFENIHLVCAGNHGMFSYEDNMYANYLINSLISINRKIILDDYSLFISKFNQNILFKNLIYSKHYNHLLNLGKKNDIEFCLKNDIFGIIPVVKNNSIIRLN